MKMERYDLKYILLAFGIGIIGLIIIDFVPANNLPQNLNIGWLLAFFGGFLGMDAAKK